MEEVQALSFPYGMLRPSSGASFLRMKREEADCNLSKML